MKDDSEYLAWLRKQPSWISGKGPCQACHVRRVSRGAGTGRKPPFFAVPMTAEEHATQTNNGELACIIKHGGRYMVEGDARGVVERAKTLFDDAAESHYIRWVTERGMP